MFDKLKRFFQVIWRSATDFSYYKDIYQAPFSFSVKYLFFLLLLLNLIGGIGFASNIATYLPKVPQLIEKIKTTAKDFFPNDLVITLNNGKVHTNVDEPYFIDFKTNDKNYDHFITIDTKASVDAIKQYKTVILVTKNALVFPDKQNSYRVQLLDDVKGYYMIDKYTYNNILSKLFPYLNYLSISIYILIILSIVIFPIIGASFNLLGKFLYLLIMDLVLLLIAKILKNLINYRKIFQLSLHGLTIPVILSAASPWLNFNMPPFSYSLIFLLLMVIILSQLKEKASASPKVRAKIVDS